MFQTQLITQVVDWERRLEIDQERRENHRSDPYVNYLAAPQPCHAERPSIFARIFRRVKDKQPQPEYRAFPQESGCGETQPG